MTEDRIRFQESVLITISFLLVLWVIKYIEVAFFIDFSLLGILPRTLHGSVGILTSPLVHGDYYHLFSNSVPLLFSGIATFYFYKKVAPYAFLIIYVFTGIFVWLLARNAYHIGASGLVYGLVSFLFFSGVFRRDVPAISISLIIIFLYSGMFYGLFPSDESLSWESHSIGAFIGLVCSYSFRKIGIIKPIEEGENTEETHELTPTDTTSTEEGIDFTYIYKEGKDK